MPVRALLLLLLLLPGVTAAADRCIDMVAAVDQDARAITDSGIESFLNTFRDPGCKSVEYAEWASEMVFTLMGRVPEEFFRALKSADPAIAEKIIVDVLDHPIHDRINYPRTMIAIESRIADEEVRDYAVDIFRPYYEEHIRFREVWEQENNAKWEYEQ